MNDTYNAKNPTGGAHASSADGLCTMTDKDHLLRQVLDRENLNLAWARVRANKGAAGIDGMTLDEFPEFLRKAWPQINQQLLKGNYHPAAVRRVEIPKPNGGVRLLGVPRVLDRLIQQAILQVLNPLLDPHFSEHSYGFRSQRSAHEAVRHIRNTIKEGYKHAVDIDLEKFFDTVEHAQILKRLAKRFPGQSLLVLIGRYLRAGVEVNGKWEATPCGMPQGGPLSPLLSNLVLDDFDKLLEARGHRFARYADDAVILVKSQRAAQRVMKSLIHYLESRLKLKVNATKSQTTKANDLLYLGFSFRGGKILVSPKSLENFKYTLKSYTNRNWAVSMDHRLAKLQLYVKGWMNYYGVSEIYRIWPQLDQWLRRRVRMCYWVMWRRPKTRIKNLIKLGAQPVKAIMVGGCYSAGPWYSVSVLAVNHAMNNTWLAQQGLINIADQWWKLKSIRGTA